MATRYKRAGAFGKIKVQFLHRCFSGEDSQAFAKKWTQAKLAALLGVDRSTVAKWFDSSNVNVHNATKPDARVKLPSEAKKAVVERIESGATQAQVAADFGVSQKTISNVVKKAEETHSRDDAKAFGRFQLQVLAVEINCAIVTQLFFSVAEFNAANVAPLFVFQW